MAFVGALSGWAAWSTDPRAACGLDGAVQTLSGNTGGAVTLSLIAVGFIAFGLYSFARARYARL